jgi:hypothetical protein
VLGISKFKIVPCIFLRKNLKKGKLMGMLNYPLSIFNHPYPEKKKKFFNRLAKDLINMLDNWKEYRPIRGMIEDIFKLAKDDFSLRKLHRYTKRSVEKIICLDVLSVGVVVSLGFNSKEELQRMAEW